MNYRIRQPILFAVVMGIGMTELAFALQTTSGESMNRDTGLFIQQSEE